MVTQCSNFSESCYGVKEMNVLLQLGEMLGGKEVNLDVAMKLLSNHLHAEKVILTVLNRENSDIKIEGSYGVPEEYKENVSYQLEGNCTGRIISTGETVLVHKIKDEPSFKNLTHSPLTVDGLDVSFIGTPIHYKAEIIGSLSFLKVYRDHFSFDEDARFLKIFGSMLGRALHRRQEYAEELEALRAENTDLKRELRTRIHPHYIKGNSSKMNEVFTLIDSVAPTDSTVLIRGESGVGKELIADAIHYASGSERRGKPFIKVNCAALPESLIESELFGHEKGAFTGAGSQRIGHFESANRGTIFLDEIGEIPMAMQVKLLRVIQEKEIVRLGSSTPIKIDVRIICATNENLETLIEEGKFREDLYYRINVFPIYIPPLRERVNDIPVLANFFIEKYNKQMGKDIKRITSMAIDMLMVYSWPGNIRELENCIERACILSLDGVIRAQNLPPTLQTAASTHTEQKGTLAAILERLEKQTLIDAMIQNNGNMALSARQLGITERMMGTRMGKYEIDPKQYKVKE